MNTIVSISFGFSFLAYVGLLVFCVYNAIHGITGRALIFAALCTTAWLSMPFLPIAAQYYLAMEPLVHVAWILLLVRALGLSFNPNSWHPTKFFRMRPAMRPVASIFGTAVGLAIVAALTALNFSDTQFSRMAQLAFHLILVVINVLGLVLIEQLARNVIADNRWRLRYLTIGLALIFSFGLLHHALAILLNQPVGILVALQPAVFAILIPFVVIASLRNASNDLKFSLSRTFVFRTGVLVATGSFLFALGLFGYIAQIFAGEIGVTIAVFLAICAVAAFTVILGSTRFRSLMRVQLSKTFFQYRYDYREEWMRVTSMLTEPDPDFNLAQQVQRALMGTLHAKQSGIWIRKNEHSLLPLSQINADAWFEPFSPELASSLTDFYQHYDWVLDLEEAPTEAEAIIETFRKHPAHTHARFIIPLFVQEDLFGICLVGHSEALEKLVWEDFDILKFIAKQSAGVLALEQASNDLRAQEQMSAVNQVSAFLLHDIKTIAAQLSLMLENADRHRDNPAFIDDMLSTTGNSLERMQKIIAGLKEPGQTTPAEPPIELSHYLQQRSRQLTPGAKNINYNCNSNTVYVEIPTAVLDSTLDHLEQNAVEASKNDEPVVVELSADDEWAQLRIIDSGEGMSEEFVKNELFTPFRSSKGLSGMGIGAYQALTNVRNYGGDLHVQSNLGVGTTFTIKLPLTLKQGSTA